MMSKNTDVSIMLFGYKESGKDFASEYLRDQYGISFAGSSFFACELFLFDRIKDQYGYSSAQECYDDRRNHRQLWYESIRDFNKGDRARLGRLIFAEKQMYTGIRDREEFEAIKAEGLFDLAVWIDASDRLPPEDFKSMNLTIEDADLVIDNNGSIAEFKVSLDQFYCDVLLPKINSRKL